MFTVYFDTAFYVALARASDAEADDVLDALDTLGVRTVLSHALIRELLTSANRPEKDLLLHARVRSLANPSYQTASDLSWDLLLVAGDTRRELADTLGAVAEATVAAESAGVVANTTYPHGLKSAAQAHTLANAPFAKADGSIDLAQFGAVLAQFAPLLATHGIVLPEVLTEENMPALQASAAKFLESAEAQVVATKSRLVASSVATDNRPYETVLGIASAKARANLGHTFRDAGHMAEFAQHAKSIDAFQMDGPQYRSLTRDAEHELRRLGLYDRCFTAATLGDVMERVREIATRRDSSGQ